MESNHDALQVCPWPGDKSWVYSITFDEALIELHEFTVPILEEYNCPGHLEVVVGHIGVVRQIGQSSYNGFRHMSGPELRDMLDRGWGVGNHSWSHGQVIAETADQEIGEAKQVLEEAVGEPVTLYCAPGSNVNMNDDALLACRRYGYLGAMSLTDDLNRPHADDLLWMNRTFLHERGYEPFNSSFDPFRRIHHAGRDRGWVIDYLHCPLEEVVHPTKDCSQAQLRERIETIVAESGDNVWLAKVDDATDYRYMLKHLQIASDGENAARLSTPDLPDAVRRRGVTLSLPASVKEVEVDRRSQETTAKDDRVLFDLDLSQGRRVSWVV